MGEPESKKGGLTHRLGVVGFIVGPRGILLVKRKREPRHWSPPGGRLGRDETPSLGLVQRLHRQLGKAIDIEVYPPFFVRHGTHGGERLLVVGYPVRLLGGEIRLSGEFDAFGWFDLDEIAALERKEELIGHSFDYRDFLENAARLTSKERKEGPPPSLAKPIPLKHIGLIPDGNRRWARKMGLDYFEAYSQYTMPKIAEILKHLLRQETEWSSISVYLLSRANLQRPREDLASVLMSETNLLRGALLTLAVERSVQVIPSGVKNIMQEEQRGGELQPILSEYYLAIKEIEERTKAHTGKKLFVLTCYDPVEEVLCASAKAERQPTFLSSLDVGEPLDLIIRTSGERRLSNFLPLQAGYAELVFIDKLFPDVTLEDIEESIDAYYARHRRFGG